jgi:hypothetical protein
MALYVPSDQRKVGGVCNCPLTNGHLPQNATKVKPGHVVPQWRVMVLLPLRTKVLPLTGISRFEMALLKEAA